MTFSALDSIRPGRARLVRNAILMGALVLHGRAIADEIRPEFALYADPLLEALPAGWQLPDGVLELWQQALQRPEADYQRLAAEAIAEAADEGLPGLEPAQLQLRQVITAKDSHPVVVHAAARGLIALDDRQSAAALFEASRRSGQSIRLLVEPALAAWEFDQAGPLWRQRLADKQTGRRDLILALDGLARLQETEALEAMLEVVRAPQRPFDVRLAAARAAGALAENGLEDEAMRLSEQPHASLLHRLCAVALLGRHNSAASVAPLERLAADPEPAVAASALGRLRIIDPALALPLAEGAVQSADPKLRRTGADVLVALPTPDRVATLSELLDDEHPDVRSSVRDDLYRLAEQPALSEAVREEGMRVLATQAWRGQEQAALLLGALDHEAAAPRLLELLTNPRPEVMVSAAWALRNLAVDETREPILEHARRQTARRLQQPPLEGLDEQVAHLFEALGLMNELAAESLLREYVPKRGPYGYYSRGAAIWALGLLHAGTPDESLASQLMARLNDYEGMNPELDIVFETSAVALGRMQAVSQVPPLRERLVSASDRTLLSVRWALEEITGQALPPLAPTVHYRTNWFLEPIGPASAGADAP